MQNIHIINPAAGKGRAEDTAKIGENDLSYITECVGDAERFVKSLLDSSGENDEYRIYVYGGDGTINEAVNGIIGSSHPERALLHPVAAGSGNDFLRMMKDIEGEMLCDVIAYRRGDITRYSLNMLNIGFDCNVVAKLNKYKGLPLVSGSGAYILGVADVLCHRMGEPFRIDIEKENGEHIFFGSGDFLLCAVANGGWCGGGFNSSPLSSLTDGLLEVTVAKKVSRARFIALVGDYKKGTHIDPVTGQPHDRFAPFLSYIRCRRMNISGMKLLCADGEVEELESTSVEILPRAVRVEG